MRAFFLERKSKQDGMDVVHVVAEGIEYTDGHVSMRWIVGPRSTVSFEDIGTLVFHSGLEALCEVRYVPLGVQAGRERQEADDEARTAQHTISSVQAPGSQRDAIRAQTAIESLRVGLLKLAVREEKARAAEDGLTQHVGMAPILALREAARLLGMALGELDLVTGDE